MKKSLMIGCDGEIARYDNGKYYILAGKEDWDAYLKEVTKEEFKNYLLAIKWIPTSGDKELMNQYYNLLKEAE